MLLPVLIGSICVSSRLIRPLVQAGACVCVWGAGGGGGGGRGLCMFIPKSVPMPFSSLASVRHMIVVGERLAQALNE